MSRTPRRAAASVRNLNYATSPLLASKTPPWRSRFVVALVGLAFAVLVGRAVYIQIIGTDFYQQQGDKRYGHVIDVPASRGRIVDRNGQVLKPAGEFGTMVEPFAAGSDKDLSMDGHAAACRDLRVVVTTYACRDANAVRVACPGPLRAVASGGIEIDRGGAAEGTMKGAVEG